jgi:hypothetical protein
MCVASVGARRSSDELLAVVHVDHHRAGRTGRKFHLPEALARIFIERQQTVAGMMS